MEESALFILCIMLSSVCSSATVVCAPMSKHWGVSSNFDGGGVHASTRMCWPLSLCLMLSSVCSSVTVGCPECPGSSVALLLSWLQWCPALLAAALSPLAPAHVHNSRLAGTRILTDCIGQGQVHSQSVLPPRLPPTNPSTPPSTTMS